VPSEISAKKMAKMAVVTEVEMQCKGLKIKIKDCSVHNVCKYWFPSTCEL
jgi:hypothetical protein